MRARLLPIGLAAAVVATATQAATLTVPLNHSVRLPLAGPAQSVVVGSPSVVDVAVVDSRTVYVSGKTPGDTDVTVIDPLGRVVFRGNLAVAGGASVSVFRGATRTEASCTPYCHDVGADGAAATTATSVAPVTASMTTPPTSGTMTSFNTAQTLASLPAGAQMGH